MGACITRPELRDYEIEKENERDFLHSGEKLLLLGPGESGKTTFLKQLVALFGKGHDPKRFAPIIYKNIYVNFGILLSKWEGLSETGEFTLSPDLEKRIEFVRASIPNTRKSLLGLTLPPDVAQAMSQIWKDPIMQRIYEKYGQRIQLLDSSGYFFDRLEEIGSPTYVPTTQDCILARVRTNGVNEFEFLLEQHKFKITDPGGQRGERKKWMHLFEGSAAVVFFVAISEFDQFLFEDKNVNRMDEALALFEQIATSRHFMKTPIILFLNKYDLFKKKIEKVAIKSWREDFPYEMEQQDVAGSVRYFKELFASKFPPENEMYTHLTCMIDDSCKDLFLDVAKIVTVCTAQKLL